ncbi:MAG: RloB domain-containing protein [Paludibacteraceae bacterium]|nr:RloB domain-containing protein [Paludibacteraceae bacterium]
MAKKRVNGESKRQMRANSSIITRTVGQDEIHKRILVVGEGVNTEPSYFEKFKEPHVVVVPIGLGEGTCKLVHDVEGHKEEEERKLGKKFDEVWVAFDKDSFPDFEQAIAEARDKGYQVAYSNQAVEYWFILHFMDHQGAGMSRNEYAKTLNALLKKEGIALKYDPDAKEVSEELFNVLYKRLQLAYDRAEKVYCFKQSCGNPTEESVTTIHLLVKSIKGMTSTAEQRKLKGKEESMRKAGLI